MWSVFNAISPVKWSVVEFTWRKTAVNWSTSRGRTAALLIRSGIFSLLFPLNLSSMQLQSKHVMKFQPGMSCKHIQSSRRNSLCSFRLNTNVMTLITIIHIICTFSEKPWDTEESHEERRKRKASFVRLKRSNTTWHAQTPLDNETLVPSEDSYESVWITNRIVHSALAETVHL